MMKAITKKQIQLIKIGQKQLGIDDTDYREMLQDRFSQSSCTKLSHQEAKELIDLFVSMGFKVSSPKKARKPKKPIPRKGANVIRLMNTGEREKINKLISLIEWKTPGGFSAWLKNKYGISRVRTANEAFMVIEGLKKIFENRMKKDFGGDWWVMNFAEADIREYIQRHCPARYR